MSRSFLRCGLHKLAIWVINLRVMSIWVIYLKVMCDEEPVSPKVFSVWQPFSRRRHCSEEYIRCISLNCINHVNMLTTHIYINYYHAHSCWRSMKMWVPIWLVIYIKPEENIINDRLFFFWTNCFNKVSLLYTLLCL